MGKINLRWYHIAGMIALLLFSPITFLTIRPEVSRDVIAVPSCEPSIMSPVAPVFARAPYFIIYDIKKNTAKYLVNNFADKTYKVGLHVARLIVSEKAGIVIAKNVGAEPYEHLAKRGIEVYHGTAVNVQEAIYKYVNNMLLKTNAPTGYSKVFTAP
jgi:predicted Fe-Mo cluster-binding NifX family protein